MYALLHQHKGIGYLVIVVTLMSGTLERKINKPEAKTSVCEQLLNI